MSNTTITCTRRLEFDAAHRVMQHEGKCRFVHGHRYVIEASFASKKLDDLGRVVDFGIIKELLGGWIDQNWDHTLVLWDKDEALGNAIKGQTKQHIYYMPSNPTAENMAEHLLTEICPKLFADWPIYCTHVRVRETPNCHADASLSD
jgi:6-pyruvoyltetrahydropterin/6-carboxytetrahydropterin synthase